MEVNGQLHVKAFLFLHTIKTGWGPIILWPAFPASFKCGGCNLGWQFLFFSRWRKLVYRMIFCFRIIFLQAFSHHTLCMTMYCWLLTDWCESIHGTHPCFIVRHFSVLKIWLAATFSVGFEWFSIVCSGKCYLTIGHYWFLYLVQYPIHNSPGCVSHWPRILEVWVWSQASACRICGRVAMGQGFSSWVL